MEGKEKGKLSLVGVEGCDTTPTSWRQLKSDSELFLKHPFFYAADDGRRLLIRGASVLRNCSHQQLFTHLQQLYNVTPTHLSCGRLHDWSCLVAGLLFTHWMENYILLPRKH
jgi:hypothetical protein